MRRAARVGLLVALAAGMAGAAWAGGTVRAIKRTTASYRHVYWAEAPYDQQPGGVALVYVTAIPAAMNVGDRFDVIDAQGYYGRVVVDSIEDRPLGCGGVVFKRGTAHVDGTPARLLAPPAVAVGPAASRGPRQALLMTLERAGKIEPLKDDALDKTVLDLDGDGVPDLMRQYFYCQASSGGQRSAFCIEAWARAGSRWSKIDETRFDNCY